MEKEALSQLLSEFARSLSPTAQEREFVARLYDSIRTVLDDHCLQIGSFPRFTSVRPLHDLDVLFLLGNWSDLYHDPREALNDLLVALRNDYENPTSYDVQFILQTHSISLIFLNHGEQIFSIDIVPAYSYAKNEFGHDTYKVPEILQMRSHKQRDLLYKQLEENREQMGWISSDPRGYIKIASEVDASSSGNFRKLSKLVKFWNYHLRDADENLKLTSFHLELICTDYFQQNPNAIISDAFYDFFLDLPSHLATANQIPDRADPNKFIDAYLKELSDHHKQKILLARDNVLRKLEELKPNTEIGTLFDISFDERSPNESFLFDSGVKTYLSTSHRFEIDGFVRILDSYSSGWLRQSPQFKRGVVHRPNKAREIDFQVSNNNTGCDEIRWKVRNSDDCEEPRGEITLNHTRNRPEKTKYAGRHYVEAYAIKDNVCIAKSRVWVNII